MHPSDTGAKAKRQLKQYVSRPIPSVYKTDGMPRAARAAVNQAAKV
jgi:hypothetical protein